MLRGDTSLGEKLREKAEEVFKRNGYVGISEKGSEETCRIMGTSDVIYKNGMKSVLNDKELPLESEYLAGVIERSKKIPGKANTARLRKRRGDGRER